MERIRVYIKDNNIPTDSGKIMSNLIYSNLAYLCDINNVTLNFVDFDFNDKNVNRNATIIYVFNNQLKVEDSLRSLTDFIACHIDFYSMFIVTSYDNETLRYVKDYIKLIFNKKNNRLVFYNSLRYDTNLADILANDAFINSYNISVKYKSKDNNNNNNKSFNSLIDYYANNKH